MASSLRSVAVGALYGVVAGACTALAIMFFVPEVGHPIKEGHLLWDMGWAVAYSWPVGLLAGIAGGAFLHRRAQSVSVGRLLLESAALASAAIAVVIQFVLPSAWNLPRARITAVAMVVAAVLAVCGGTIIRPLLPKRRGSHL